PGSAQRYIPGRAPSGRSQTARPGVASVDGAEARRYGRAMADPSVTETFTRLVDLMARLRAPGGCPWDREQTPASLRPYLLEEVYEVLEAIDADDPAHLRDELGDLLLQIVFQSELAAALAAVDPAASEHERGDLLLAAASLGRHLAVSAEMALRAANDRFVARVRRLEAAARVRGQGLADLAPEERDRLWEAAKLDAAKLD